MTPTRATAILGGLVTALVAPGCRDSIAPPASITVTAVSPAAGPIVGGTSITITGANFIDVTNVTMGDTELADRTVLGPADITGTTPVGVDFGPTDVIVTSSSKGGGRCSDCFRYTPLDILARSIAAGQSHTCALTSVGAAYCWGANYAGELGDGSRTDSPTPIAVSGGLTFRALAADAGHETTAGSANTCGLTSNGAAYCWGNNGWGQLGDGSTTSSSMPVAVAGGLTFSVLTAGAAHTCGLTSGGAAYCWGRYDDGELGTDPTASPFWVPAAVSGGLSFSALATGSAHTCGLTGAGVAYCWGANTVGQLGVGTTTGPEICHYRAGYSSSCSRAPVPVATALRWASITAGHGHTCALTPNGAAYCWGLNSDGQLGDGTLGDGLTPVAVVGGMKFSALFARLRYTCGLTESGAAYCWGYNGQGQLGDGSAASNSRPVAVAGGLTFSSLAAGFHHTCGVTTSGAVYCWGENGSGQLGNGSTTSSPIPVAVAGWP